MKSRLVALLLGVLTLAVGGCSTIDSRIKEKSAAFAALSEADQQRVRKGTVAVGDTFDVVYIALGRPDVRHERRRAAEHETVWVYKTYYETYAGHAFVGYRRYVTFDPYTRRYFVYHEPVYTSVYREQAEDDIRVTFADGRVTAIEQQKR